MIPVNPVFVEERTFASLLPLRIGCIAVKGEEDKTLREIEAVEKKMNLSLFRAFKKGIEKFRNSDFCKDGEGFLVSLLDDQRGIIEVGIPFESVAFASRRHPEVSKEHSLLRGLIAGSNLLPEVLFDTTDGSKGVFADNLLAFYLSVSQLLAFTRVPIPFFVPKVILKEEVLTVGINVAGVSYLGILVYADENLVVESSFVPLSGESGKKNAPIELKAHSLNLFRFDGTEGLKRVSVIEAKWDGRKALLSDLKRVITDKEFERKLRTLLDTLIVVETAFTEESRRRINNLMTPAKDDGKTYH